MNTRIKKPAVRYIFLAGVLLVCCVVPCAWILSPTLPGIDEMYMPAWSVDGQSIALECFYNKWEYTIEELKDLDLNIGGWYHYQLRDICIVTKNLQLVRRLTLTGNMHAPAWSPNGQLLAWLNSSNGINIWEVTGDRIKSFISSRPLGYDTFNGDQLVWLQDNTGLYLQGSGVRLDLVSEQFHYLPEQQDGLDLCCSAWSTDGRFVAVKQRHEGVDIQDGPNYTVIIYKDSKLISKSNVEATYDDPFAWSPDNTVLTWVSNSSSYGLIGDQLTFALVTTGEVFTLDLRDENVVSYPAWSPNGAQLAYRSYSSIHVLTLQHQVSTFSYKVADHLTFNIGDNHPDSPLVWSPDGQQITYGTSDGKIVILSLSDGRNILEDP